VAGRYLQDFAVGEVIDSPETYEITTERLHEYAAEFDPQPMHLDLAAAERSVFGRLVASGWHTLSVTMRLMVGSPLFESGAVVGVGIDKLRWLRPVGPRDVLRARAEVLEVRPSRTHDDRGYLVLRVTTLTADGAPVVTQEWTVLVPRRPA
jgi:acyl dehydratase